VKPLAYWNKNARRLCISLEQYDAQILMYALNRFVETYGHENMDSKAQQWAKRMEHLSGDIQNAL